MKKRILFICGDLNPKDLGGAEVHIVEVIKGLADRGHKCEVFVGDSDAICEIFTHENINVHTVSYMKVRNFASITYTEAAVRHISEFLHRESVDILHAKQVFPQAYIGAKLARRFELPLYVTVQNPMAYKEEMVLRGRIMRVFGSVWLKFAERWVKIGLKAASFCGCVSRYSESRAIDMGAGKTGIVPNGVDTHVFHPAKERVDGYKIVTTSTLIPRNGIDTLVRAFGAASAEFPEATLEIAGEGPMEDELRSIVGRQEYTDNKTQMADSRVKFLGTLSHKEVPDLLRSADLFVRPSRFEGFGVSFIEAMACGVPVITCPSGGIVDFVVDGETGILVPPDKPDQLANAIISVFRDRGKLENLKKNALQMVRERYSWDKIVDKVEEAYRQL